MDQKPSTCYVLTKSTISGPWRCNDPRPSPDFSPWLQYKIWEWPGDEAIALFIAVFSSSTSTTYVQAAVRQSIIYVLTDLHMASQTDYANRLHESTSWISFLMASGGACIASLRSWLCASACVVCDKSSRHWHYEPVTKPHVQLAKFFCSLPNYSDIANCCI